MSAAPEDLRDDDDSDAVARARATVRTQAVELDHPELADDGALVISELVTNAILHGGGCTAVDVRATDEGIRVEVRDASKVPPVVGRPSDSSLTGRGLQLVSRVASRWGAEIEPNGKVVWAELGGAPLALGEDLTADDLLAMWDDDLLEREDVHHEVVLGDVPTDLLLAAKSHVDNLVREFALASAGARAGLTSDVPPHLATLLQTVVGEFSQARVAIKHQALEAARRGAATTRLVLSLPASAASAGEAYAQAIDEVDAYCRARRLLTLETPPQHRMFRQWYIGELVRQLRAAAAGAPTPPPEPFEMRLLAEIDRLVGAQQAAERAARLSNVAVALARAATPEAVAEAVLTEGVVALSAVGGGMLLQGDEDTLMLPGAVGYDEVVVARLRTESRRAELPAAYALRTGESVWIESREERDRRFPEIAMLEPATIAMCAVPLEIEGRSLGALRFSFVDARLFDDDERRFVLALAALTAQALVRAQLQQARIDVSRRLQRTLLPPSLPELPGVDVAAIYHPFGDGMDVGGDFYDLWPVAENRWAIAIGDVAGTGPEAAGLTGLVRHTLRALTLHVTDPVEVLTALNRALLDAAVPGNERFCTAVFGIISCDDAVKVELATGGHPGPTLRRADGAVHEVPLVGTFLGVFEDAAVGDVALELAPGDTLVLYTDGVIEARGASGWFDSGGVRAVLAGADGAAATTTAAIEEAVLAHTGGSLNDDMAAIALHVERSG